MFPFGSRNPYCKRCEYNLNGGEDICPRCQYSPRQRGLRVALWLLLMVVVFMSVLILVPSIGRVLIGLAGLAFLFSFATLVLSFLATPYRLGGLFLRL
jgi:hypothetical protein